MERREKKNEEDRIDFYFVLFGHCRFVIAIVIAFGNYSKK